MTVKVTDKNKQGDILKMILFCLVIVATIQFLYLKSWSIKWKTLGEVALLYSSFSVIMTSSTPGIRSRWFNGKCIHVFCGLPQCSAMFEITLYEREVNEINLILLPKPTNMEVNQYLNLDKRGFLNPYAGVNNYNFHCSVIRKSWGRKTFEA